MVYNFPIALLLWGLLALAPLVISVVYFLASPGSEPVSQRLAVAAHGVIIFSLSLFALLVAVLELVNQKYAEPFRWFCLAPLIAIAYSFLRFNGNKMIHWLQTINLVWLILIFIFGQMAVTGIWV